MKALEVDPDERFQDAGSMGRALEQLAARMGIPLGHAPVAEVMASLFERKAPSPARARQQRAADRSERRESAGRARRRADRSARATAAAFGPAVGTQRAIAPADDADHRLAFVFRRDCEVRHARHRHADRATGIRRDQDDPPTHREPRLRRASIGPSCRRRSSARRSVPIAWHGSRTDHGPHRAGSEPGPVRSRSICTRLRRRSTGSSSVASSRFRRRRWCLRPHRWRMSCRTSRSAHRPERRWPRARVDAVDVAQRRSSRG